MQLAFINAAARTGQPRSASKTIAKVVKVANRVKVREVPAVNTKLSFRTAQKLIAEGVIE